MFNILDIFKREPKPFATDYLPEQDGHKVFYQQFGNPEGEPIISFHGGPGSRSKAKHAAAYDLKKYRVIMFDQRGCGLSEPLGEVKNNTTADVLKDAKRILDALNINKLIVSGGSWGSTLALLFAEAYPEMTTKLVVASIWLARGKDLSWTLDDSRIFYPDMMEKIEEIVPEGRGTTDYYAELMFGEKANFETQKQARELYGSYEHMVGDINPAFPEEEILEEDIAPFKIFLHYEHNKVFIEENQILNNIDKIKHIPTLIVHNRLDMICPVEQAWLLHKAMPSSKLFIVPDHGHGSDMMKSVMKKEVEEFLS